MIDTATYIRQLKESSPLREPLLREIIQAWKLPPGSRGLDVGCGIGQPALLLAEVVGAKGHITGLDSSSEFLHHAEDLVHKSGLSNQISFQEGDAHHLPFDDGEFDWVWSADCVGYPGVGDPPPLIRELARVVKPGGKVGILTWTSQKLLPGYPLLEARLNVTSAATVQHLKAKSPESNFLRALGWFRNAGLEDVKARTFVGEVSAPLDEDIRIALISFFQMLWGEPLSGISKEDWNKYERLCLPDSPDFILNVPDYYAFFTYTMFQGKIPH
ncbi:MAG: methyltransferase domain-containing protein [Candidatus Aminicenantes bacterium]|jgi:demethylmenaquinone methyltransferase/2-methoxy-6-polyprenyl-1,4-benzoquinol methylase